MRRSRRRRTLSAKLSSKSRLRQNVSLIRLSKTKTWTLDRSKRPLMRSKTRSVVPFMICTARGRPQKFLIVKASRTSFRSQFHLLLPRRLLPRRLLPRHLPPRLLSLPLLRLIARRKLLLMAKRQSQLAWLSCSTKQRLQQLPPPQRLLPLPHLLLPLPLLLLRPLPLLRLRRHRPPPPQQPLLQHLPRLLLLSPIPLQRRCPRSLARPLCWRKKLRIARSNFD